ncbi:MAG: ABC transporter permease [Chitinophagales bacterium]|nr:ABC transporter permease [Chitinophagales bacterium]MDW8427589.1 ABC transporter permease [Chitinophagales bacterium]
MSLIENIRQALRAIAATKLRTLLTMLIIAFGIMALVGILTAIDSLKNSINESFSFLGANTFTIERKWTEMQGKGERRFKPGPPLLYSEAIEFRHRYRFPAKVSVHAQFDFVAVVRHGSKQTDPNVSGWAADEHFLEAKGYALEAGRYFTSQEIREGAPVMVVGKDLVKKIFDENISPLGKFVTYKGQRFQVIGVLATQGSSMIQSTDRSFLIPASYARRNFLGPNSSWTVSVTVADVNQLATATEEAIGTMRMVRGLGLQEENDFAVEQSDELAEELFSQLIYVRAAAILIGIITLFGAAVGLMNIMLVSVTERTMEIGVSKALGATKQMIRRQFLVEAVTICLLGGLMGIVLGMAAGNLVSIVLGGSFVVPWVWIICGLLVCFLVGLASGLYPAVKASRLDPIEALRYE